MSNRDGNPEIYVMNRDGSNVRRLTNNPAIDTTPTWSPTGTQIAFTSDRTGAPQIYVIGVDGSGVRRISSESYRRPRHLVAGAVQRDRVRGPHRPRLRHQDPRTSAAAKRARSPSAKAPTRVRRGRRTAATWRSCRRGGQQPDLHGRSRRPELAADHAATAITPRRLVSVDSDRFRGFRGSTVFDGSRFESRMRRDANRADESLRSLLTVVVGACAKKTAAGGAADAAAVADDRRRRAACAARAAAAGQRAGAGAAEPVADDRSARKSLDDLNRDSPLKPLFFELDSADVSADGQQVLQANAAVHEEIPDVADHDRGPLRRARHGRVQPRAGRAARAGGEELPGFARHSGRQGADRQLRQGVSRSMPGHEDAAWSKNRRAHFVITAK